MIRALERLRAVRDPGVRSEWVDVAGLRWHYRRTAPASDCPPLVLVHGMVVSSRYMIPTAGLLGERWSCYLPDLPGFGRSWKPRRALDVPALADALRLWIRAMGLRRPALLANSFGCQVVADLAARFPDEVGPLVLVGPTMDAAARSAPRQIGRWVVAGLRAPADFFVVLARDFVEAGVRRTLGTFRHALRDPVEETLPSIRVPALVVRGARDPLAPQRWAEELTRRLPRGELRVLTDAAHVPNYAAPRQLARVVQSFLDRTVPVTRTPA